MRKIATWLVALFIAVGISANGFDLRGPKGEDERISGATFALYASSVSAGVNDRFVCTAEAIAKVPGGYELLTAGHCTPRNSEIPGDATYFVATDIGGELMPVSIVKAVMKEPLDFAILYLPTKKHFNVEETQSVTEVRVNDKVTDVNFALGLAKQYSHGTVGSLRIHDADPEINGDFLVQMDGGPGSSGSGVLHDGKLIGIVIYGFSEGSIGMGVEPIDAILAAIPSTPAYVAPPAQPVDNEDENDGGNPFVKNLQRNDRGSQRGHNRPAQPREPRDTHRQPPARAHQGPVNHRRIDRRHDERIRNGHVEVCFAGTWFAYGGEWPDWVFDTDVYAVEVGPGVWEIVEFQNPSLFIEVVIVD
jgi:hypothetical protein